MPSIGPLELLIVLAIVVVLFGATRIGDIGKGIGRGIREFRSEIRAGEEEGEKAKPANAAPPTPTADPTSRDETGSQVH
jgi:sec-independent protein translocase protein TatA